MALSFSSIPLLTSVIDIALLSLAIYQVLSFIQGTRALAILIGLGAVLGVYLVAQYVDLPATVSVINLIIDNAFIVVIILFQDDIRRALARVGRTGLFRGLSGVAESQVFDEVAKAASALASHNIGALMVIERDIGLRNYIEIGTSIDGRVDRDLLYAIFLPHSPLHDGAVIIEGGRLTAAGCLLPLNVDPDVSKAFGTRHRAALGLTAETDAVVVVVSEETGTISLSVEGRMTRDLDGPTLRNHLLELFR